ncbi:hypothetical protein [Melittangium boletus]|uniref:hypothetical protein n=1 Tax=Melittangium boletus TaxID=83453 RepID=UPI003DA4F660
MLDLVTALDAKSYMAAYQEFIRGITQDKGHKQIAAQCVNGVEMFWKFNVKKGERYQILYEVDVDASTRKVVGLSRISIPPTGDDAKIQDVVAYPDGQGYGAVMMTAAIAAASGEGKKLIWLEAADAKVAGYYAHKFQFQFTTPGMTSGRMTLAL